LALSLGGVRIWGRRHPGDALRYAVLFSAAHRAAAYDHSAVSACRRRKVVYAPSLWNCCRRRWPPFHRRTLSVLRMVGDECRAHEICALHLDAIAARAGVRCKRTTMSHAFRATVMIAAAAGALSEMVGERLMCRASISMPRPIRYKMEKNWVQLGRGEVRRRHQGPNRSQRRKSIWGFDRAHSTDLQKPARPIHRLSRTGCRWPYRKSTRRGVHIPKALNSTAEQHDLLRRNHPFRARMTTAIDLSLSARVRSLD
jgi:hypothetical protein